MTTASSAGHIAHDPCPNHDAEVPNMGARDIDMQTFRHTCVDLLIRLNSMGPGEGEAEQRRQSLMKTIAGAYTETRCDQTMILTF